MANNTNMDGVQADEDKSLWTEKKALEKKVFVLSKSRALQCIIINLQ